MKGMAGHTGQSSQLFPITTGRNAQFLATVSESVLVRQVEIDPHGSNQELSIPCPLAQTSRVVPVFQPRRRDTVRCQAEVPHFFRIRLIFCITSPRFSEPMLSKPLTTIYTDDDNAKMVGRNSGL